MFNAQRNLTGRNRYLGWTAQGVECERIKADCSQCSLKMYYGIDKEALPDPCMQPKVNEILKEQSIPKTKTIKNKADRELQKSGK